MNFDDLKITNGYWYLATPYSKYKHGIEEAWKAAASNTAHLIKLGIPVFSPIAHTHPIAIHGGIDPYDHEIWMPADQPMMDQAHGLIVCKMEGWDKSFGVQVEIEDFKAKGKPVHFMEDTSA